jgi:hypothetical protein
MDDTKIPADPQPPRIGHNSGSALESDAPVNMHLDRRAAILAERGTAAGNDDQWLNTQAVADWLGMSKQWVELRRKRGDGPPFFRPSPNAIIYRRGEIVRWLYQRHHHRTAEYQHEAAARSRPRGRLKGSRVVDGKVMAPPPLKRPGS